MQKTSALIILSAIGFLFATSFTACTPTGTPGAGVTSDGYSAPAPVSPVDRTEALRSQYRDQMR
ncbi:MAG: hypothetical protein KA152_16975 [Verrucomicrobiales bacterium]|nr:hypothetical protein [Verrucomicrobiales bacterium]